jgi:hypothetical protein
MRTARVQRWKVRWERIISGQTLKQSLLTSIERVKAALLTQLTIRGELAAHFYDFRLQNLTLGLLNLQPPQHSKVAVHKARWQADSFRVVCHTGVGLLIE